MLCEHFTFFHFNFVIKCNLTKQSILNLSSNLCSYLIPFHKDLFHLRLNLIRKNVSCMCFVIGIWMSLGNSIVGFPFHVDVWNTRLHFIYWLVCNKYAIYTRSDWIHLQLTHRMLHKSVCCAHIQSHVALASKQTAEMNMVYDS